jgi:hypothetical protein
MAHGFCSLTPCSVYIVIIAWLASDCLGLLALSNSHLNVNIVTRSPFVHQPACNPSWPHGSDGTCLKQCLSCSATVVLHSYAHFEIVKQSLNVGELAKIAKCLVIDCSLTPTLERAILFHLYIAATYVIVCNSQQGIHAVVLQRTNVLPCRVWLAAILISPIQTLHSRWHISNECATLA